LSLATGEVRASATHSADTAARLAELAASQAKAIDELRSELAEARRAASLAKDSAAQHSGSCEALAEQLGKLAKGAEERQAEVQKEGQQLAESRGKVAVREEAVSKREADLKRQEERLLEREALLEKAVEDAQKQRLAVEKERDELKREADEAAEKAKAQAADLIRLQDEVGRRGDLILNLTRDNDHLKGKLQRGDLPSERAIGERAPRRAASVPPAATARARRGRLLRAVRRRARREQAGTLLPCQGCHASAQADGKRLGQRPLGHVPRAPRGVPSRGSRTTTSRRRGWTCSTGWRSLLRRPSPCSPPLRCVRAPCQLERRHPSLSPSRPLRSSAPLASEAGGRPPAALLAGCVGGALPGTASLGSSGWRGNVDAAVRKGRLEIGDGGGGACCRAAHTSSVQ